jgi:hypothetical protein
MTYPESPGPSRFVIVIVIFVVIASEKSGRIDYDYDDDYDYDKDREYDTSREWHEVSR